MPPTGGCWRSTARWPREPVEGVTETVPTYRSLLVHYDPVRIDFDKLGAKHSGARAAAGAGSDKNPALAHSGGLWRRARHRPRGRRQDAQHHARRHRGAARRRRLPRRHDRLYAGLVLSQRAPGFAADAAAAKSAPADAGRHRSRSAACRPACNASPARAAGICLGQTAVRTYQLHRDPTFLLEPGDAVTFAPVDAKTFAEQDRAAEAGEIVAELIAS